RPRALEGPDPRPRVAVRLRRRRRRGRVLRLLPAQEDRHQRAPPAAHPARRRLFLAPAPHMKSWPLRVKLVALMMILLAVALVSTAAAHVYSRRDSLNKRLDQQLHDPVTTALAQCGGPGGYDGHGPPAAPAQRNGFYIACVNNDGSLSKKVSSGQGLPTLPDTV